jgi:hypothetical protein
MISLEEFCMPGKKSGRKCVVKITHFAKFNVRFHSSPVANTQDPISLRLPTELHIRLQAAGDRLGIPKHSLAQMAIKAAIEAVRWQICWQWAIFKLIQKHKSLLFMML